jgi:hypothetical protein
MLSDGMAVWRGEWLYNFPKYRNLTTDDLAARQKWVNSPGVERFLDEIIELCAQFAERSRDAAGHFLSHAGSASTNAVSPVTASYRVDATAFSSSFNAT